MKRPLLICPGFFDQRMDGVGRVSGALATALERLAGAPPYILSSNDPRDACTPETGRCFGRQYGQMLISALFSAEKMSGPEVSESPSRSAVVPPIVCSHLGLSPVARILAARTGREYLVFIHGIEAWKRLRRRQRWGVTGAARLLVNSHYTLEHFCTLNPWARSLPALVTPLGVPVTALLPVASASRGSNESYRILSVGRMVKEEHYRAYRSPADLYKGFKLVIEAVAILRTMGVPAVLDLVGDGNARRDLEAWVATQPFAPFVNFLGRIPDDELARRYASAKVFVLASEGEGFGLVFAEAMAHGLPCVGVAAGATPEVVIDDESGYVVRARDSRELAERLFVLHRNPKVYARLSSGASARHAGFFSEGKFIDRLVAALKAPLLSPVPHLPN